MAQLELMNVVDGFVQHLGREQLISDGTWSGGGYALDEVILFFLRLGADGKSIQNARAQGVSDRFRGPIAKISLAQNLHPNDALTLARICLITPMTTSGSASI